MTKTSKYCPGPLIPQTLTQLSFFGTILIVVFALWILSHASSCCCGIHCCQHGSRYLQQPTSQYSCCLCCTRFMCSSVRCSTSFLEEVMVENKNGQSWRSDDCYVHERQLVLSLCLDKLQGSRMPSLHRSVLLANTMRHIQWEITQEKECPPGNLCSRQIPQFQEARPLHVLESQFQAPDGISILSDIDLGCVDLACSRCAEKVEINMDVSYLPSAFVTSSSYTPFTDSLIGLTLLEAGTTQGYLSDLALDDIFEDIDTSMYDSSEASSIMTCVFCSVSHLFGGDDETKVLRDCPSASPQQRSLTDLNDLDHIMEVLVGLV